MVTGEGNSQTTPTPTTTPSVSLVGRSGTGRAYKGPEDGRGDVVSGQAHVPNISVLCLCVFGPSARVMDGVDVLRTP